MAARMNANTAGKQRPKMRPPFKVRHEPPTLEEAIYAAQGLTTDVEQQVEIAADLMSLPSDEVRPHVLKAVSKPSQSNHVFVAARSGLQRAVVIETTGRPRNRASTDTGGRVAGRAGLRPAGQYEPPRSRFPS
ncbi:MAG: hypothetical protein ACHQAY_08985 [Hyphomicrobiales bacterium]